MRWVLAIDFGTSFTVAAVSRDGGAPTLVQVERDFRTPSSVAWNDETQTLVGGRAAVRRRLINGNHFVRAPKRLIDTNGLRWGGRTVSPAEMWAAVLGVVLDRAKKFGGAPAELRLTHPAAWGPIRTGVLREAAMLALDPIGWTSVPVSLIAEPVAAATEVAASRAIRTGRCLAIYDLGGGTFDAAVVQRGERDEFKVVGPVAGAERGCGGEDFDDAIKTELGKRLRDRQEIWDQLVHPSASDAHALAAAVKLDDEIVETKECLSTVDFHDLELPELGCPQVTREELNRWISGGVGLTIDILLETIECAKRTGSLDDADFVGIALTGGASNIPLVEHLLRQRLHSSGLELAVFSEPDPKGVVAQGATRLMPALGNRHAPPDQRSTLRSDGRVPSADLSAGSVLAGCRVEREAGRGGMAVVYRATQISLGRTVALKVMARALAGDVAYRARFEREWRAAAAIDHESVVPIHFAGESDGRLYIVMRFVDGDNLKEVLLSKRRLEPAQAIGVVAQIASGLDAAHARGLVHRDVKPANVLVESATGRVYLTDFGIARSLGDTDDDATRSEPMGSARYMAPERNRGDLKDSILSDVYSLGCLLWDVIGGTDRPDLAGLPAVSEELRQVVLKAMAPDPAQRFESAGALARAAADAIRRRPNETAGPQGPSSQPAPIHAEALSDGLCSQVLELCGSAVALIHEPQLRRRVERIQRRVGEPLSIAVAGRSSSGKSTLINALLGRQIAETGAQDTTRLVTWYRHGKPERVEAHLRGGEIVRASLTPDRRLPKSFGTDHAEICELEVFLCVERLRTLTIIDTPGLDAQSAGAPARAPAPLGVDDETAAVRRADALLFAIAGDAHADDQQILQAFRRRFEGTRASAVNVVAVLTKADVVGGESDDALEPAFARAATLRNALGSLVTTVVPFVGLLAETANPGVLAERDVAAVSLLAGLDQAARRRALRSVDGFLRSELVASADERRRLVALFGLFGLRRAVDLAGTEDFGRVALARRMRELSGIEALSKELDELRLRADALKADLALDELDGLSWKHESLGFLGDRVEEMRWRGPNMYLLDLIRAFDRCAGGEVELAQDRQDELKRLVTGRTLAVRLGLERDAASLELRDRALERARDWRAFENSGFESPAVQRVAAVVTRAYDLLSLESAARP